MAKSKIVTHFMSNDNVRTNDTSEVPLQERQVKNKHMNFKQIFGNVFRGTTLIIDYKFRPIIFHISFQKVGI